MTRPNEPAVPLLLIEDDILLARSLLDFLTRHGYAAEHCADGGSGLSSALAARHRIIILDRMLPGMDGMALVRALRQASVPTPVIFLTTRDGIDDRVEGLEAGADDYLIKPFALEELLARIRVLIRRPAGLPPRLRAGALEIDVLRRSATRAGRPIELLPQEYRLLEFLARNANQIVTRRMLLEHVWDIHFDPHTSVVESHISRLRGKLNAGFDQDLIQTIRGIGYRLLAPH